MKGAYYNENDKFAAAWLRELIKAGLIADGEVDERSIELVRPDDLRRFVQCHFFAGIGGWSYALRLAGWPDDREVWTGSCPCQPFSAAGKGAGADDSRDLWPTWFNLLRECRPHVCFGEQVSSADGLGWLDRVSADLEGAGYALAACDCCAAGIGAFHIRQRLWFVAHSNSERRRQQRSVIREIALASSRRDVDRSSTAGALDNPERGGTGRSARSQRCEERETSGSWEDERRRFLQALDTSSANELGHANGAGHAERTRIAGDDGTAANQAAGKTTLKASPWSDAEWIACSDGKARPVEPGTFPLAHGVPARVGRLRGYGNAIVPQVAQVFIEAYLDCYEARR